MDAQLTLYKIDTITGEYSTPDYSYFAEKDNDFKLIEDEKIDIESINELLVEQLKNREHTNADIYMLAKRQNELVQAVKQLNQEIKELKSLDIEIIEKEINEALKRARNKEYCQVCGVELTEENKYMKNMCYDCKYGEE